MLKLILQTEISECGLACVGMIAGHYGYVSDLSNLRNQFKISSQGTNLKQLMDISAKLELAGRALQLDLADLSKLQLPCILHWDMNHFVVLKAVGKNKVTVLDPAIGEVTYSHTEFSAHFTGIALELTPTAKFERKEVRQKLTLSHFWQRIFGLKRNIITIVALSFLLQLFAVVAPFYMQTVVDDVLLRNDGSLLLVLALGFGLLMLLQTATDTLRSFVILHLSTKLNYQMAANLFRHLIRLPLDYFEKRHIGDVVSRFGSLQSVKDLLTTGLVSSIVDGVMAVITLTAMFIYSVKVALVVLVIAGLYTLLRFALYRPFRRLSEESIIAHAKEDSNFMESVRAIQTVKLFQRENDRQNLWQNKYTEALNTDVSVAKWGIAYETLNSLLFGIENIVVIYLLATSVMGNLMSLGMLYAFMSYKNQFVARMDGLIDMLIEFKMIGLHLDRLADITFTEAEDVDRHTANLQHLSDVKGSIEVKNLTFRYSETDDSIFENISFRIPAGQSAAIVGPSGCGKTTLLKVMMGLLKPNSGQVLVDGVDITKRDDYRTQIAAVMQDDQLLSGSVADNIACFDPKLDFEKIALCAQKAAVHEDILKFGMRYNTLVGDMGTSLSGGQKQRVILARALYREPKLLFLDEATSHLDVERESVVNSNIKKMDVTRIIVAHRPETIKSADVAINMGQLNNSVSD
ncbi:peptidase domain-containing ABC transporter [Reinekea forsetii]|nr:peptidase domain-containing ABC transporter [Reinekea forsetii]